MDDDLCDQEALEALLNDEEDDVRFSSTSDVPSVEKKTLAVTESIDEFLNANSEDEDGDLEKSNQKTDGVLEKNATTPDAISTQALQEEMMKMQAKMMELQRLLELQNVKQSCKPSQCDVIGSIHKSNSEVKSKQFLTSSSQKVWQSLSPSTEGNGVQQNIVTNKPCLTLLPDSDDSIFLNGNKMSNTPHKKVINQNIPGAKATKQSNSGTKQNKMAAELFGDSDSDWDDLDGEDKRTLSEAGKDLKRIMQSGEKKREAHQAKFEISNTSSSGTWTRTSSEAGLPKSKKDLGTEHKNNHSLQCKTSSSDHSKPVAAVAVSEHIYVDAFSKIRIVNPLISTSLMKTRMEGRKMISVSKIHLKLKTPDLQGDWVTIAAVVGKTDSKSSSSGKPYSIWKLNDLEDLDNSVSFFLFGEVHKHLWKTDLGTVVGVLNPSIMDSMEKSNSEPAFTIKNVNQLMIMGKSKDLAWCVARTKAGNKCIKFINKKHGDFCAYHVAAEYRKTSAQRLELHGSIAGVRPKSFESKVFSKDCAYIYGGKVYSHQNSSSAKKKGVTLTKLQNTLSQGKHQKINTLSINNIKPESLTPKQTGRIKEDPDDTFLDLISVPSPGSMNLVAFLKNKDSKRLVASTSDLNKGACVVEVTAKDLIKQHQQLMKQKRPEKRKASDILMDSSPVTSMAGSSGKSPPGSLITDPLKQVPTLGKGFYHGQEITLDVIPRAMSLADRIKLKAVAAIKQKGGLKKEDPNAVRKVECSDVDKISKRAKDEYEKISSEVPNGVSKSVKEPPKKKSRLLGDVDLNSDDIKSILKAKSKHKGALAEAEAEREDVYFNELEKKEKLEEKLQSVTSIEIKVFTCKQCLYTAQSALESCKQENHTVVTSKAKKRFFMCKKCKNRTFVIGGKFPTESCRNCGTLSYEKTSMYKVRSGPKLDSEVLNLRGDEVKFLSSMDQKVFLNTVID